MTCPLVIAKPLSRQALIYHWQHHVEHWMLSFWRNFRHWLQATSIYLIKFWTRGLTCWRHMASQGNIDLNITNFVIYFSGEGGTTSGRLNISGMPAAFRAYKEHASAHLLGAPQTETTTPGETEHPVLHCMWLPWFYGRLGDLPPSMSHMHS